MSMPIPDGWRELKEGEIISRGDKLSPRGDKPFKFFKETSASIGMPYRAEETPLYQDTIVIRKIPYQRPERKPVGKPVNPFIDATALANVNVICKVPASQLNKIRELVRKHPVFSTYNLDSLRQTYDGENYVYILTGYKGANISYIGVYHAYTDSTFKECKKISLAELYELINPPDLNSPKFKNNLVVHLQMDIRISQY